MPIHPKVIAGTSAASVGGALAVLVVWALGLRGIVAPDPVAEALTVLFTVISGAVSGYLTPSPSSTGKDT